MDPNDFLEDRLELPPEAGDQSAKYFEPNDSWIETASEDYQTEAMRQWFYARFEDPAQSTPYIGSEGGYLYVHSGPHDPDEELQNRFGNIVEFEVIRSLVEKLYAVVGTDWAPLDPDDYDPSFAIDFDHPINVSLDELHGRLTALNQIKDTKTIEPHKIILMRMIYGQMISCLEAFLAKAIGHYVTENETRLAQFVEGNKDLASRTLVLSEVIARYKTLEKEVYNYLSTFVWHRLDKLARIANTALVIELPNIKGMMKHITVRHDIVHRAGKTIDGQEVDVTEDSIIALHNEIMTFAESLAAQLIKIDPL